MFSFTSNQRKAILFFFLEMRFIFQFIRLAKIKKKKVIMLRVSESVEKCSLSYMGGG